MPDDFVHVKEFMRNHGIPEDRIDFARMSDLQRRYETEIFSRRIGGNAWPHERQYEAAKDTANNWRKGVENPSDYRILDVGCGQGYHLHFLEQEGFAVEGVNLSVVESELARHGRPDPKTKLMMYGDVNRKVTTTSVLDMPFDGDRFNAAAFYGVLMMVPHTEKIFNPGSFDPYMNAKQAVLEIRRVLASKGVLHMVTMKARNPQVEGPRTEDYIAFDTDAFFVYDEEGKVADGGGVGMGKFLTDCGFDVESMKLIVDDMFWNIRARKR